MVAASAPDLSGLTLPVPRYCDATDGITATPSVRMAWAQHCVSFGISHHFWRVVPDIRHLQRPIGSWSTTSALDVRHARQARRQPHG